MALPSIPETFEIIRIYIHMYRYNASVNVWYVYTFTMAPPFLFENVWGCPMTKTNCLPFENARNIIFPTKPFELDQTSGYMELCERFWFIKNPENPMKLAREFLMK